MGNRKKAYFVYGVVEFDPERGVENLRTTRRQVDDDHGRQPPLPFAAGPQGVDQTAGRGDRHDAYAHLASVGDVIGDGLDLPVGGVTSATIGPFPFQQPFERLCVPSRVMNRVVVVHGFSEALPGVVFAEVADQPRVEVTDAPCAESEAVAA